jgi:hypothetical protein
MPNKTPRIPCWYVYQNEVHTSAHPLSRSTLRVWSREHIK